MNPVTTHRFDPNLLSRFEDAGLNASAPPQQRWLDGWFLRLSPGKAKRARCINAVAPGRMPVPQKLALCEPVYAQAGLPLIVRVTPFSEPPSLDAELDRSDFAHFDDTRVMWLPTLDALTAPTPIALQAVTGDEFAEAVGALRGTPPDQCAAHAGRLRQASVPHCGFVIERDGRILACGQFAREDTLVGLYDVFTAPEARRQGLASALCAHLLLGARAQGARIAYLQVDAENHGAISIYRHLGFEEAYTYHYRARSGSTG